VLVYTNTYDHRQVVEVCARHGVHVMMEKPLAVSLEDARAIRGAAKQGKIHVVVNYETTWYRSSRAAYDLVRQNGLGDIRKIVVHDGDRGPQEINVAPEFLAWLTEPTLNGAGALFDFGCYGADLATWLMQGRRPDSVTAIAQHIKPDVYPRVDDEATIILTYPKAQAIIQASWNWPFDRKIWKSTARPDTQSQFAAMTFESGAREQRKNNSPPKRFRPRTIIHSPISRRSSTAKYHPKDCLPSKPTLRSRRFSMPPAVPRLPAELSH